MRRLPVTLVAVVLGGALIVITGCSAAVPGTPQAAGGPSTSATPTIGTTSTTQGGDSPTTAAGPTFSVPLVVSSNSSPVPPTVPSTSVAPTDESSTPATSTTTVVATSSPATTSTPAATSSHPTTSQRPATTGHSAAPTTANGSTAPWQRADGDAWFQTADGSVRCAVGPSQGDGRPVAICRVAGHSYQVPASPGDSCAHWGDFVFLSPSGADFECYSDARFDTAAHTLPAGSTLHFDGFTCQVGTVNVVCQYDSTTQAFTVNPTDYQFWSTAPDTTTPTNTSTPSQNPTTVDGHNSPWHSGYDWAWFKSPSGNIACMLGDVSQDGGPEAICEIAHHTYTTPKSGSCTLDYGDRFIVGTTGKAYLGCHGDTVANDAVAVLPYGTTVTWGGLACTSSESGMWCGDLDSGHHFKVASAAYELG